ncbi:S8 family serine peptidase [Myceligenerans xiligouense]|uniref:Subtilisin family serine protease n=1 Tax=Myceligenerans xiligouense TaxID=253184 RepID=A0A3N4YNP0_9MICO|nr:S8 family serine peptidase [Myceligenerans xiligouense]RPF20974.1 subtilisin family serine protease [Myceligenerans xiligouense]
MQPLPSGRRRGLLLGSALVSASLVLSPGAAVAAPAAAPDADPVRVIIELDSPTAADVVGQEAVAAARTGSGSTRARSAFAADYRAAVDQVEEAQQGVTSWAEREDVELAEPESVTGLLSAVVATVDPADLDELRSAPDVARVTESAAVRILGDEANIPATGAPQVWERDDADGTTVTGDGRTVAIIDTGIDYTLDDLGGGFGPGHRVADGYDFVNDDADPMDDHMHGTHVAGIVGAGGDNLTGMAPDVTLTAWKAMDARGGGTTEDLLLALEAATDPLGEYPADVVNMSLGTPGDGTDPLGRASTAAVRQGVVVVAAAGNSGPYGQSVSSPAAAEGVIAVGAQVTGVADPTLTLDGTAEGDDPRPLDVTRFPMSANPPAEGITARLVDVGDGFDEEDYEKAGDVRGAIVVMQSFTTTSLGEVEIPHLLQAELAEKHGAVGALLYMPSPTDPAGDGGGVGPLGSANVLAGGGFDLRRESLVMMNIASAQYQTFKDEVAAGTARGAIGSVDRTDTITDFSSRGPSDAMTLKPEIVAPGFEIMSDVPAELGVDGDQYRMSGTSMAAPHVAGAAALLAQARPEQGAEQLRATLIGSAQPLGSDDADVSPSAQGGGKLDVAAAVDQQVTAAPDALSLGLADMGADPARTSTVVLRNSGAKAVTVKLAAKPAAASTGEAELSTRQVRIPAGRSASVDLTVTPDTSGPDAGSVDGETSGVVVGTVSDGTTVRIPYATYVRPLRVQASPSLATGTTEVFVYTPMAPEAAPTVRATAPSGEQYAAALTPLSTSPGWYRGTVPLDEPGTYALHARATVTGRTLTGTGGVQSEGTDQPGAWEQVGLTGTARELATSPTTPGTGLAMAGTGVHPFVTTDFGETWQRVRSMPVADGWGSPVADTSTPGGFYVALNGASGRVTLDPSYSGRIVHTPDAGETWTVLPFPDVAISELLADGDALAAVTDDGVYLSQDGGRRWRRVAPAWNGLVYNAAFAGDDLLIATYDGVYRIADALTGGSEVTQPYVTTEYVDRPQGVVADGSTAVLVRGDGVSMTSADGGATWTEGADTGQSYVTVTTLTDGTVYASGLSSYSTSTDLGQTWQTHPLPVTGPLATDVDHWPGTPAEQIVMSMENAGIYTTDDGQEWTRSGVSGSDVTGVHAGADADGEAVLRAVDAEGLHQRSLTDLDPDEQNWGSIGAEGVVGRLVSDVTQSPLGDRTVWAIGTNAFGGGRILTAAAGESDADLAQVGPAGGFSPTALAVSPHAEDTVAVGYTSLIDTGLMVSTDGFETWTSYAHEVLVQEVVLDPAHERRLWLATTSGLYRSDDLGRTITRLTRDEVRSVWVDPADTDHVVIGEAPGIRVSTDGGETFADAEVPNTSASVGTFVAIEVPDGPAAGTELLVAGAARWRPYGLAANGAGVFVSADGGATWASASQDLTAMSVRSLTVSPDGAWVYAGADEGGVHRTAVSELVPDDLLPAATSTQIKAPSSVRPLEPFRVKVTVSADDETPSGRVTVTVGREGDRHPYERTVKLRGGKADVLVPPLLRAGDHTITAEYEGTEDLGASDATAPLEVKRR